MSFAHRGRFHLAASADEPADESAHGGCAEREPSAVVAAMMTTVMVSAVMRRRRRRRRMVSGRAMVGRCGRVSAAVASVWRCESCTAESHANESGDEGLLDDVVLVVHITPLSTFV